MKADAKLVRSREDYRKLRQSALDAMTGDHPNAIWYQMAHMITDELWFKAVVKVRRRAGDPPFNHHLWDAFVTGYGVKQSLAIRRLTDVKDGTASLLQIVKKMAKNSQLLTREVVVGYSGSPISVDALFQKVVQAATLFGEGSQERAEANERWHKARDAHDAFDRLRTSPMDSVRLAQDRISDDVLARLESALTSDAIKRVRHRCDKFLAHADLSDLSSGTDGPTYDDIRDSIRTLVEVKQFLCADFFNHSSSVVVPTYQANQFEHLSVPFVPPMPADVYANAWETVEAEMEEWGNVTQFGRFRVHPETS